MTDYVQVGLFILLVGSLVLFAGCTETSEPTDNTIQELQTKLDVSEKVLTEANNKIIELQENAKYSTEELRKARLEKTELQEVYNDLFLDTTTCFYANYCLYNEEACLYTLGDLYPGMSAREIHYMESDWCDGMYRDWGKYQEHDSSIGDE